MWHRGKFAPSQSVIRSNQFVLWSNPDSFQSLIDTLCDKFNGKVELRTKLTEDREMFGVEHFSFCRLGTKKGGSVEDYELFVEFLRREKAIDLIYDRDTFERHALDEEEQEGIDAEAARYALRSGKSIEYQEDAPADSESESSESSLPSTILTSATGSTSTTTLPQNLSFLPPPSQPSSTSATWSTPTTNLRPKKSLVPPPSQPVVQNDHNQRPKFSSVIQQQTNPHVEALKRNLDDELVIVRILPPCKCHYFK
jgi:hypothetical protein